MPHDRGSIKAGQFLVGGPVPVAGDFVAKEIPAPAPVVSGVPPSARVDVTTIKSRLDDIERRLAAVRAFVGKR
jgi:hypothetical protein